nr:immunoglobulin light chain junction region [Macaca mulatta]MOW08468.1 immunoglobulin light chain junction region [Macaca mulatta]MOW08496.1 immunoglobulin light chain junction region [Macaca mulatta]MOW09133.1 immunoglobulin light chain junction region [Macaca mulatta]MOW09437.1 immunoglobulin light chain junction region [Macaca mulatta]
CHQHNNYPYTF